MSHITRAPAGRMDLFTSRTTHGHIIERIAKYEIDLICIK